MKEFDKQSLCIREELAQAKSQIHISFDLRTAPNSLAFCAVVALPRQGPPESQPLDRTTTNQRLS